MLSPQSSWFPVYFMFYCVDMAYLFHCCWLILLTAHGLCVVVCCLLFVAVAVVAVVAADGVVAAVAVVSVCCCCCGCFVFWFLLLCLLALCLEAPWMVGHLFLLTT